MTDEEMQRLKDSIRAYHVLSAKQMKRSEKRMDYLERLMMQTICEDRRERREWRKRYNALRSLQSQTEDTSKKD